MKSVPASRLKSARQRDLQGRRNERKKELRSLKCPLSQDDEPLPDKHGGDGDGDGGGDGDGDGDVRFNHVIWP